MVDLDEYCREGNCSKVHKAKSTENTGRASRVKSLKCEQNFACSSICDYDEITALTELHDKNISVSHCWSLNSSLIL